MFSKIKKTLFFVILFSLLLYIFIIYMLNLYLMKQESKYLLKKTTELQIAYSAITNNYDLISEIIFSELINKSDIVDIFKEAYNADEQRQAEIRKNLLNKIEDLYNNLNNIGFINFHFQLPDCRSFLRLYAPEKYGDDLSLSRYPVLIANTEKIKVSSFEIGSVYSGYRYIFPMFYNDVHIGSVEIGISCEAIKNEIEKIFKTNIGFLLNKEMVEKSAFKYNSKSLIISSLNEEFVFTLNEDSYASGFIKIIENVTICSKNKIVNEFITNNSFSIPHKFNNENYIISFLPIFNFKAEKIAYIISVSNDTTIAEYKKNTIFLSILFGFILLVVVFLAYYLHKHSAMIKQTKEQFQSITECINEGLFVINRNFRVVFVNPAAEKISGLSKHEILGREISNIIYYKNEYDEIMPVTKCPNFDNIDYGLTFNAKEGIFITKNQKDISIELSVAPLYQKANLSGYLILIKLI